MKVSIGAVSVDLTDSQAVGLYILSKKNEEGGYDVEPTPILPKIPRADAKAILAGVVEQAVGLQKSVAAQALGIDSEEALKAIQDGVKPEEYIFTLPAPKVEEPAPEPSAEPAAEPGFGPAK